MRRRALRADALLLLTAIIWGFAFVAQREGMTHTGPFAFNAVRFTLGSVVLLPFALGMRRHNPHASIKTISLSGVLAGGLLFVASALQQIGVVYTTAGKAGFITGLYVILVPLMGLAVGQHTGRWTWLGAVCAVMGLYLLTVTETFTIAVGDLWVLAGAFFWAAHVLIIGRFSLQVGALRLALIQFVVCAALSFGAALLCETLQVDQLVSGARAILYTGILSVGVAYTLQAVAQKDAPPAQAALVLSLETVFAVFGGWLILGETLPPRGLIGCGLMFAGMIVAQLDPKSRL